MVSATTKAKQDKSHFQIRGAVGPGVTMHADPIHARMYTARMHPFAVLHTTAMYNSLDCA